MTFDKILFFLTIYSVGLTILVFISHTILEAGEKAGGKYNNTARTLIYGLWTWAIIANAYSLIVPSRDFIWVVPSFVIPLFLVVAVTFLTPVKKLLANISITKLVAVQLYRNAGALFLIAYYFTGTYMSKEFADIAGWGDVLTGLLAVPTAMAAYYRIPFWHIIVIIWCCIGTADLIIAPTIAQIYGGPRPDDFPINTIPIFFGPPLGIILHIIALRAIWLQHTLRDRMVSA